MIAYFIYQCKKNWAVDSVVPGILIVVLFCCKRCNLSYLILSSFFTCFLVLMAIISMLATADEVFVRNESATAFTQ